MKKIQMQTNLCFWRTAALFALFALLPVAAVAQGYEVWMVDQNNTAGFSAAAPRGTHGGRLLIYDSSDLDNPAGLVNQPTIFDLATVLAAAGPNNSTGANVVRPHMAVPSPDGGRYMAIAFVASGHVAIFDGKTKAVKALFRMQAGAAGARQAHAAFWTPDGSALIVANQNGKLLERITYNAATDTFTHDLAATLNLATCTTPGGMPCQSATPLSDQDPGFAGPHNRPDNAPICPIMGSSGRSFVSLRGGGLFVVDVRATPMAIVAEYGNQFVGRDGCGGVQNGWDVYLNAGTGTLMTNPTEFSLYHFKDMYPVAPFTLPPNFDGFCPTNFRGSFPRVFFRDSSPDRDAHGMVLTTNRRYLWQFDRIANVAEVFRVPESRVACAPRGLAATPQHVGTVSLNAPGLTDDATLDLGAASPLGNRIYVAMRGPRPQTGAHAAVGSTPGLAVIELAQEGRTGKLTHVLRTTFLNPFDNGEESDPHAAFIRVK
jgi:hypothetical protein